MKQTGTFHVYEIKNSQRVVSPISNAFIYFVQDNSIKLTVKTDDKGKYSFDLPLGEYTVVSSSEGGIEQLLANGSKFILNAQSKVTAFEEWVNAPSADVDTALLKRFKELAKIAEDAAREANEVLAQLEGNSIGTGKWMREGAWGLGGSRILSALDIGKISDRSSFFGIGSSAISPYGRAGNGVRLSSWDHLQSELFVDSTNGVSYRYTDNQKEWQNPIVVFGGQNTRTDKNNVLHSGTGTPLTTLNTSDMSDKVVNRDDITVTSGAVYREIKSIPKPDMSEYRKLSNNVFDDILQVKAKGNDSGSCVFLTDTTGKSRIQMTYTASGWQLVQVHADDSFQIFTTPKKSGEFALKEPSVGSGKIMREGAGGLLSSESPLGGVMDYNTFCKDGGGSEAYQGIHFGGFSQYQSELRVGLNKGQSWISWFVSGSESKASILHSFNTTVDSNGFIKKASPIIKLFNDRIETNDQFYDEPIFEKIGVGTYKISNTKGLSKDGWTYEKPRGSDGNPYFRVLVKKTEDGCIISVHDEYDSVEEATITDIDGNTRKINKVVKVLSQARDIKPHERWIDLRFHEEPREETEPTEVVQ